MHDPDTNPLSSRLLFTESDEYNIETEMQSIDQILSENLFPVTFRSNKISFC
jgi:hypothetical protein